MSDERTARTDRTAPPDAGSALQVVAPSSKPARFEAWPDDVKERCRELWSSIGNRNAGRVEWFYGREVPEGIAIPAAITIRQWAREEHWGAWADADLAESHGRTLRELRTGWLAALRLSQETLIDSMTGRLDALPHGGAGRIKSAEVTLRIIAQSGLLAVAPEPDLTNEALEAMTPEEQQRHLRDEIQRDKSDR